MNGQSKINRRRQRPGTLLSIILPPVLVLPLVALWILGATEDESNIALQRNDVVRNAAGQNTWRGTLANRTDSQYRDIAVTIHFVDGDGARLGEVSGQTERLEPGETLDLDAPLPEGATGIRVHSLEWRTGRRDKHVTLGPYAPWVFGQVESQWP